MKSHVLYHLRIQKKNEAFLLICFISIFTSIDLYPCIHSQRQKDNMMSYMKTLHQFSPPYTGSRCELESTLKFCC